MQVKEIDIDTRKIKEKIKFLVGSNTLLSCSRYLFYQSWLTTKGADIHGLACRRATRSPDMAQPGRV